MKYDLFAQPIPSFHIDGQSMVGTNVGSFFTGLLAILVVGYSCARGRYLVTGDRPNISSFVAEDERNGT